jgi:hypothetical protein
MMAIVMQMRWEGVTPEQYAQAQEVVKWESDVPKGGVFHVAWFESGALRVTDVWETAEDFQTFVDQRLMPGVAEVGIQGEPQVEIQPAHRIFDAAHGQARS